MTKMKEEREMTEEEREMTEERSRKDRKREGRGHEMRRVKKEERK